jgi:hypothetical protein
MTDVLPDAVAKSNGALRATPAVGRGRIVLDGQLLDEHALLLDRFDEGDEQEQSSLAVEVVASEERLKAAETEFVFHGTGRGAWRKLLGEHPPTDADKEAGADYNTATFPVAAMVATLVEPGMATDRFERMLNEELDEVRFGILWGACLKACLGGGANRPSSAAARRLLGSAPLTSGHRSS